MKQLPLLATRPAQAACVARPPARRRPRKPGARRWLTAVAHGHEVARVAAHVVQQPLHARALGGAQRQNLGAAGGGRRAAIRGGTGAVVRGLGLELDP